MEFMTRYSQQCLIDLVSVEEKTFVLLRKSASVLQKYHSASEFSLHNASQYGQPFQQMRIKRRRIFYFKYIHWVTAVIVLNA